MQTYFIPANYTDAGKVLGLFELRNVIEAALFGLPVLVLCFTQLPFELTTKIMVTLAVFVPVAGFALIGLADDSLTRYLSMWWRWRRRRAVLTYRGEVGCSHGLKRSDIRRHHQGR